MLNYYYYYYCYYYYYYYYYSKHHSHSTPAGAESDSNPTAAAPSQTEITDVNRSDHSTTSMSSALLGAVCRIDMSNIGYFFGILCF